MFNLKKKKAAAAPETVTAPSTTSSGSEIILGQVSLFTFSYAPMGWLPCEGQLLPVNQNMALFTLIGTKFGGDGSTTFALPNLKDNAPTAGMAYYIAVEGIYPVHL